MIRLPGAEGSEDVLFHEAVHGNQFLDGELGFTETGAPLYYDYTDEDNAYTRQFDFASTYQGRNLIAELSPEGANLENITQPSFIRHLVRQLYGNHPNIIKSSTPVNRPD